MCELCDKHEATTDGLCDVCMEQRYWDYQESRVF